MQSVKNEFERIAAGREWILQHDYAPIHTAREVTRWVEQENVAVLNWCSMSPDLNIIENLWGWLTRKLYEGGKQYQNISQLEEEIKRAWREIPRNLIESLYRSLPDRIFEVINVSGKNTHY